MPLAMINRLNLQRLLDFVKRTNFPESSPIPLSNNGLALFSISGDVYNSGTHCAGFCIGYIFDSGFVIQDGRLKYDGSDGAMSDIYWRSKSDNDSNLTSFQFSEINRRSLEVRIGDFTISTPQDGMSFVDGKIFVVQPRTIPYRNLAIQMLKDYNGIEIPPNRGVFNFEGSLELMPAK